MKKLMLRPVTFPLFTPREVKQATRAFWDAYDAGTDRERDAFLMVATGQPVGVTRGA